MWADELHRDWCIQCIWKTREVFHLRFQITVGERVPPEALTHFRELEQQFPTWPFFRPERRSPEIAEQVGCMVRRNRRASLYRSGADGSEYRRQQAEEQAPDAEPGAAADGGA